MTSDGSTRSRSPRFMIVKDRKDFKGEWVALSAVKFALAWWDQRPCTWGSEGESQTEEGSGLIQERRSHVFLRVGKGLSSLSEHMNTERGRDCHRQMASK